MCVFVQLSQSPLKTPAIQKPPAPPVATFQSSPSSTFISYTTSLNLPGGLGGGVGLRILVSRRGILLLLSQKPRLLLGNNGLLVGSLVERVTSGVSTGSVGRLAEEAPQANNNGANRHTDQANGDTSDETDEDRKQDVRGDVLEQLAPAVLAHTHATRARLAVAVVAAVMVLASVVEGRSHAHALLVTTMATRKSHLAELLHLLVRGSHELADPSGALGGLVLIGNLDNSLGGGLLDGGHEEFTLLILHKIDPDLGNVLDKRVPDFNNLQFNLNKLKIAISILPNRGDMKPKAKSLSLRFRSSMVLAPAMPIFFSTVVIMSFSHLCTVIQHLGRHQIAREWVGKGVQFKVVHQQTIATFRAVLDGKQKLEVVWSSSLDLNVLSKSPPDVERASRAFKIDGLNLCDFGLGELDFLADLEVGFADLGRDEKCVSSRGGQKAGSRCK